MNENLVNIEAETGILATFFVLMGSFLIFILIISLVLYVFQGIAVMKMADNAGIENGWLAFIPVANYWLYGELVNEKLGGQGGKKVLLIYLGLIVGSLIPIINIFTSIASIGLGFALIYWIFEKYSENAIVLLVVSILTFGFAAPIILFVLRNNKARY